MAGILARGRKLVCVGRNYVAHAKELGNEIPTQPILFLKPTSSYITQWKSTTMPPPAHHCIQIPNDAGGELHHEVELGIVMGRQTSRVSPEQALEHVHGYVRYLKRHRKQLTVLPTSS